MADASPSFILGKRLRADWSSSQPRTNFLKRGELYRCIKAHLNISDSKLPNAHETLLRLIKAKCADWEKACMSPVITTHVQFFLRVVFLKLDEKYVDHDATRGKSGAVPGSRLAVPDQMDIFTCDRSNIGTLSHFKIPAEKQLEYFSKLYDIFENVPKYSTLAMDDVPSRTLREHSKSDPTNEDIFLDHSNDVLVTRDEAVINVAVYSSTASNDHVLFSGKTQELDILGRQSLASLRDQIYCLADTTDCARNDSFFFIEDVFYIDDRHSFRDSDGMLEMMKNINAIHNWLLNLNSVNIGDNRRKGRRKKGQDIDTINPDVNINTPAFFPNPTGAEQRAAEPVIRSMHRTLLEEVPFRVGVRYLYCHENHCEHFLYFNGIRAFNKNRDLKYWSLFPRVLFTAKMTRRKCSVCLALPARHIIFGDRLAPYNPFYCCDHCNFLLHYSPEGESLYHDYHIFPYYHDMI